jgi:hypothetical protein
MSFLQSGRRRTYVTETKRGSAPLVTFEIFRIQRNEGSFDSTYNKLPFSLHHAAGALFRSLACSLQLQLRTLRMMRLELGTA